MNIPHILENIDLSDKPIVRIGGLVVDSETLATPAEVLERLKSFGGTGWYCGTDQSDIRILTQDSLPAGNESYPISAELVNGDSSLHLSRSSIGWEVTTICKGETQDSSVLVEKRLLARNNLGEFLYEVLWAPYDHLGQIELRPKLCRFIGITKRP